jgi:hypothetical protein
MYILVSSGWHASVVHGVRLLAVEVGSVHNAAIAVAVTAELLDGEEPAAEVGHVALHQEEAVA